MLTGISIVCIASSYAVAFALELSRLLFRWPVRWLIMMLFAGAGLFAHSVYLVVLTRAELAEPAARPLSSWYDWCLMVSWVLALAYLVLAIRRPHNTVGLFLLPLVLALIGAAKLVQDIPPFARQQAVNYWSMLHGWMLMLGTVTAALGFAAGVMYLVQSYRLKRKLPPRQGLRLPTLEWLQGFNRRCLLLSAALLGLGLLGGIGLNLVRHSSGGGSVPWNDPVVLFSFLLFAWLVAAALFESLYRPARQGRKMAYLTLASFIFLVLALVFVLRGGHGSQSPAAGQPAASAARPAAPAFPTTPRPAAQRATHRPAGKPPQAASGGGP
jgi:ABC-type transport system involved in cytochrome c biogenesis permease subunit